MILMSYDTVIDQTEKVLIAVLCFIETGRKVELVLSAVCGKPLKRRNVERNTKRKENCVSSRVYPIRACPKTEGFEDCNKLPYDKLPASGPLLFER